MLKPLFCSILMITLISCEKEKVKTEEMPTAPQLVTSFSRTFFYPADNTSVMKTYPTADIQASAKIADDKSLVIGFDTPYPAGNDNVIFVVPAAIIKPDYKAEYSIPLNSAQTKIFYQYKLTSTSSNKILPGAAAGLLKITGYDSRYKTISGEFVFDISAISDPVSSAIDNFRQTNIMASGSFHNLVIK